MFAIMALSALSGGATDFLYALAEGISRRCVPSSGHIIWIRPLEGLRLMQHYFHRALMQTSASGENRTARVLSYCCCAAFRANLGYFTCIGPSVEIRELGLAHVCFQ